MRPVASGRWLWMSRWPSAYNPRMLERQTARFRLAWGSRYGASLAGAVILLVVLPCSAVAVAGSAAPTSWSNSGPIPQNGSIVLRAAALPSIQVMKEDGSVVAGTIRVDPDWQGVYVWQPSKIMDVGTLRLKVAPCSTCPAAIDTPVVIVPAVNPLMLEPTIKVDVELLPVAVGPRRCCSGAGLVADRCYAVAEQEKPVLLGVSASLPSTQPVLSGQLQLSWVKFEIPRAMETSSTVSLAVSASGRETLPSPLGAPIELQEGPWSVCAQVRVQSLCSSQLAQYKQCVDVPMSNNQQETPRDLSQDLDVARCPIPPEQDREEFCRVNANTCGPDATSAGSSQCARYASQCPLAEREDLTLRGGCSFAPGRTRCADGSAWVWCGVGLLSYRAAVRRRRRRTTKPLSASTH